MSNFSDFFGSKGGGAFRLSIPFVVSSTWTVPYDMDAILHAIGGGGGGASAGSRSGRSGGGGAGGHVVRKVSLKKGQSLTIEIGTFGTATQAANAAHNGGDGGNTNITGPNISMIAAGGTGGKHSLINAPHLCGFGGEGSGGDVLKGGNGGYSSVDSATGEGFYAFGGGGVNLFGFDTSAFLLTTTPLGQGQYGGAGVAEKGTSDGRGTGSGPFAQLDTSTPGATVLQNGLLGLFSAFGAPSPSIQSVGSGPAAGPGIGGGAAWLQQNQTINPIAPQAGAFGGGGGALALFNGNYTVTGGQGRFGGGGGGALHNNGSCRGGYGGAGLVVIEVMA